MFDLIKRNFSLQLCLLVVFSILLFATYSSVNSYTYSKNRLTNYLSEHVLTIVNSSAWAINADEHAAIYWDPAIGYKNKSLFLKHVSQLKTIKDANNLLSVNSSSPIYTLIKPKDYKLNRELEFVVMSDKSRQGNSFTSAKPIPVPCDSRVISLPTR